MAQNEQLNDELFAATTEGDIVKANQLLDVGATITSSIFLNAVACGQLPMVKFLLKRGADINCSGGAALRTAVSKGFGEMVFCLVEHNINIEQSNAIEWARQCGHKNIQQFLEAKLEVQKLSHIDADNPYALALMPERKITQAETGTLSQRMELAKKPVDAAENKSIGGTILTSLGVVGGIAGTITCVAGAPVFVPILLGAGTLGLLYKGIKILKSPTASVDERVGKYYKDLLAERRKRLISASEKALATHYNRAKKKFPTDELLIIVEDETSKMLYICSHDPVSSFSMETQKIEEHLRVRARFFEAARSNNGSLVRVDWMDEYTDLLPCISIPPARLALPAPQDSNNSLQTSLTLATEVRIARIKQVLDPELLTAFQQNQIDVGLRLTIAPEGETPKTAQIFHFEKKLNAKGDMVESIHVTVRIFEASDNAAPQTDLSGQPVVPVPDIKQTLLIPPTLVAKFIPRPSAG